MRKRVMLVDDHPAMLMALKSMLQDQLLFEIAGQAQNGEECLRSIKEANPNMVILDLDMPKTDGFDVIRRIGLMYPEIRILVLSSLDEAVYGGRVRSLKLQGRMSFLLRAWRSHRGIHFLPTEKMAIPRLVTMTNWH